MRKNRGFFFIIGVAVTYLIAKLYSAGFWHQIGFMAANSTMETPLTYSSDSTMEFSLLAAALDAGIDILVWIGTIAWLSVTGLLQIAVTIIREVLRGMLSLGGFVRTATTEMNEAAKDRKEVIEVVAADKDFRTRVLETLQDDRTQIASLQRQIDSLSQDLSQMSSDTSTALREVATKLAELTTATTPKPATRSRAKTTTAK